MAKKTKVEPRIKIRRGVLSTHPLGIRIPHEVARTLPFLKISIDKSELVGIKTIVRNPVKDWSIVSSEKRGKTFFKKGEKIFRIHIDSTNIRHIQKLLDGLENNLSRLKAAGFSGFYAYGPNKGLLKIIKTKFGDLTAADINVPEKERAYELRNYRRKVRTLNFPEKHADSEVEGIAFRM